MYSHAEDISTNSPETWAKMFYKLGLSHLKHDDERDKALRFFNKALAGMTKDTHPLEWADMMVHLGDIYSIEFLCTDDSQAYRKSLACYNDALFVWTRESHPRKWAEIKQTIAVTHSACNDYESARSCHQEALSVWEELSDYRNEAECRRRLMEVEDTILTYRRGI